MMDGNIRTDGETPPEFDRQKLYALLAEIPRGRVTTYGALARMLGNPRWARAVGNALHENPDGDRYPCYRVVNSRGELSPAYAFGGIAAQERRLAADGIAVEGGKVDLARYLWDGTR
ncbi:MAG: MGMT family protein [Ruminococcaceae bacterium]|nr:MGMT family protein [Oscillospiraceae bacterium]